MESSYSKTGIADRSFHYQFQRPHPPEIPAFERAPLDVYVTEPTCGVNARTVPLLALHGSGELGMSDYLESLQKSICAKRNILVFTVDYLGTRTIRGETTFRMDDWTVSVTGQLFEDNNLPSKPLDEFLRHKDLGRFVREVGALMSARGITTPVLLLLGVTPGDHYDFGVVQAIDCLWSVGLLKNEYPSIAWEHATAAGQSHGGYLAAMCAKFAPNTFAHIVNIYGWTKPWLPWMLREKWVREISIKGVNCAWAMENYWRAEPGHPHCLTPDRLQIRTQNDEEQLAQWRRLQQEPTRYTFTHQIDDEMHPRADKDDLVEKMRRLSFPVDYMVSNEPGKERIRALDQGDNTSFKGAILDLVTDEHRRDGHAARCDWERKSVIAYDCGSTRYAVDFSTDLPTLRVTPL